MAVALPENGQQVPANHPLVSVVMCAYNALPYIQEAVASILGQTYENWELIISDDGSTDGTSEWLKQYEHHPRIRVFFQEKNIGYVANKNFAIAKAKGEYITQNDSDDKSDLRRLEKQIEITRSHLEARIIACGYEMIDDSGKTYDSIRISKAGWIEKYEGSYPFWFPSLMVHRVVYEAIGNFDPYFEGMGDDLYWTVKANEQFPIYCLQDILYSYRNNPNSITNVLNTERKLIVPYLLAEIIRQRQKGGTDWLEQKNAKALADFEDQLTGNNSFMGEQYRKWAAKAIDKNDLKLAYRYLRRSFHYNKVSLAWIRTFRYFLSKRWGLQK